MGQFYRPTLDELQSDKLTRAAVRGSCRRLENFLQHAWPYVPRVIRELHLAPYVSIVCSHLEAVYRGDIKKLLCNYPPECLKSSLVSVVFPAWVWSQNPRKSFFMISYIDSMASRNSRECRQIVESPWFRSLWPNVVLASDQNSKVDFRTHEGGFCKAFSGGTKATGEHPDFIIWDDPLNARHWNDRKKKQAFADVYSAAISTRGVARDVAYIMVQQRLAVDDPSGIVLKENERAVTLGEPEPWVRVRLPMRFDPKLAMVDRGYGGDPRTKAGELLDPVRLPERKVIEIELALGPMMAKAQLQQDPQEEAGAIFDMDFWQEVEAKDVPEMDEVCRFWDKAASEGEENCQTAGVLMGKHVRKNAIGEKVNDYYVLDIHHGHWGVDRVEDEVVGKKEVDLAIYGFDRLIVAMEEEGGSGGKLSVRSTEKNMGGVNFVPVRPGGNSKHRRAQPLARDMRRGRMFVVRAKWTPFFKEQIRHFPGGGLIDMVDAAAGAHLVLEETLGPQRKPQAVVVAGLNIKSKTELCASPTCGRPVADGDRYCCSCCEVASAFNDPDMVVDHSPACVHRNFEYLQEQ